MIIHQRCGRTAKATHHGRNDCVSPEEAALANESLFLLRPEDFVVEVGTNAWNGRRIYRGNFQYNGTHYNLGVTDPVARDRFKMRPEGDYPLNNVYTCVSLTEPYEVDGRCHKLVAAIISNLPL